MGILRTHPICKNIQIKYVKQVTGMHLKTNKTFSRTVKN